MKAAGDRNLLVLGWCERAARTADGGMHRDHRPHHAHGVEAGNDAAQSRAAWLARITSVAKSATC